ncbi:MAG: exodeoxyribonuclease VII large subunit [candidate division KSB1 bacterium]|nr:exodeoxyribonuclease VII large subunit [candidate division KSB1 bacterium]MDZ7302247.1 exodeoxyribonuclease VII large subunit [candidate division KSB1 bacterium]MDZ7311353.1 exodeoxyribonuclease VII large subunit [candidate division KSB1 bacterium]
MRTQPLTVSRLTQQIKILLETGLAPVWLTGEISNFKRHTSGHFYFSLKDEYAQIPCVMWAGRNRNLYFLPQDGMQVLVYGQVTVYEKRGYYQLEVWEMQPAGVGALQMAFEQLKQRLRAEGLFDEAHKVPLPPFPQRVGIITSPTGAAIRDLVSILRRRWPGMRIILRPVKVQGAGAAEEIAQAIAEFNAFGDVDVLIVGRGGGSLEDLWAFNEEVVARAIFDSEIPVVSAVGHEIDFSISDFVADVRAATPSAAAELVAPDAAEVRRQLQHLVHKMQLHLQRFMQMQRERLNRFVSSYGLRQPLDLVRQRSQQLDDLQRRLLLAAQNRVQAWRQQLNAQRQRLQALSHQSILQRGFAIVYRATPDFEPARELVREAGQLQAGDPIHIQFAVGSAGAKVEKVTK